MPSLSRLADGFSFLPGVLTILRYSQYTSTYCLVPFVVYIPLKIYNHRLMTSTTEPKKPSFINLPTELHLAVTTHLSLLDRYFLRLSCRHFYHLIQPPIVHDLVELEFSGWARDRLLLTCGGCLRLRPSYCFSSDRAYLPKSLCSRRFCLECGHRPLPGSHRYQEGDKWHETSAGGSPGGGGPRLMVRCRTCKCIQRGRVGRSTCEGCCEREIRIEARTEWRSYDGRDEKSGR